MTQSINPVRDLVAVIQGRFAAGTQTLRRGKPAAVKAAGAAAARRGLEAVIEKRVAAIDPDEPQRGRKAFRVFLEAVLLSQFGERLINDGRFQQMVDDVQRAMEAEPGCAPLVDRAIAQLLNPAGAKAATNQKD
ncbi:hypothetical protein HH212_05105 [Massilia forsythiae]|uniref:Uncharacterized protein n=1 Tax=Massilia forsythiae TaxID=2728020 RepID=A0A7Z2VU19_9BURK|nr:hypothetical protein [Massilia forsythiae]QJD99475.1 hypothetical protein HH212_05105 [Massilia forsythiae]